MTEDAGGPPITGAATTTPPDAHDLERDRQRFRRTLVKVMSVQAIALVLLWLLQRRYTP